MTKPDFFVISLLSVPACLPLKGQETTVRYLYGTGSDSTMEWEFFCFEGTDNGHWTTI